MSKLAISVEHKPKLGPLRAMNHLGYRALLVQAQDWDKIDLDDRWYWYPAKWEDWDRIFQYVQKNLPKYVADRFDCDNFAYYVSVMVSKEFGINTCNVVEGTIPIDGVRHRHKWNVFFHDGNFYQLESQKYTPPNDIGDLDDPDYVPDEITAF